VPWVDKLACARVPDLDVLREFKMIMLRSEAMAMDFLKNEAGDLYEQCALQPQRKLQPQPQPSPP
jgi:hypothetical protein